MKYDVVTFKRKDGEYGETIYQLADYLVSLNIGFKIVKKEDDGRYCKCILQRGDSPFCLLFEKRKSNSDVECSFRRNPEGSGSGYSYKRFEHSLSYSLSFHYIYDDDTFLFAIRDYDYRKWMGDAYGFSKLTNLITGKEKHCLLYRNSIYSEDDENIGIVERSCTISEGYNDYIMLNSPLFTVNNNYILPYKINGLYCIVKSWKDMPNGLYKVNGKVGFLCDNLFFIDL
ncbi:hypothetical protein [Acetivibrio ethanolgignens]|uniref:Uncharacterized protein n=1 Tax=Acetivibrio ethanolgignens TaxID=290052 RepID=A0A0V8QFP0_9FIRM|nr:hypothetical protein [Acetivibrio ethanolgignens]KSV59292.1 hypothetical protein ASU35_09455 [Acetivibrio ethanolgignens]